jgi:hypothetical protein
MITGEPADPLRTGGFVERPPSAFHLDLGSTHDAIIAPFLAESPDRRPPDAFAARKLLESVRWSTRALPREGASSRRSSNRPPPPATARLAPPLDDVDGRDAGRLYFDTVAERHVVVLPLEERFVDRIRAWARVLHPSLAAVLRGSAADGTVWFEAPLGRAYADTGGSLSPTALGALRDALTALHKAGTFHGCVDAEHVYVGDETVTLACPRVWSEEGSAIEDFRALERLAGRS